MKGQKAWKVGVPLVFHDQDSTLQQRWQQLLKRDKYKEGGREEEGERRKGREGTIEKERWRGRDSDSKRKTDR